MTYWLPSRHHEDEEPQRHYRHRPSRRGPVWLAFLLGALMGMGGYAMLGLTHQHPTIVDVVKPDESLCRAMLTQWLYGGEWVPRQELQQWQSFKRHMGDCVR